MLRLFALRAQQLGKAEGMCTRGWRGASRWRPLLLGKALPLCASQTDPWLGTALTHHAAAACVWAASRALASTSWRMVATHWALAPRASRESRMR